MNKNIGNILTNKQPELRNLCNAIHDKSVVIKSLSLCESDNNNTIEDLLLDVENLIENAPKVRENGSIYSLAPKFTTFKESDVKMIKMPSSDAISASVVRLNDTDFSSSHAADPFLDMMDDTYSRTYRTSTSSLVGPNSRTIGIIKTNNDVIQLEFPHEVEYWRCIREMRRSAAGVKEVKANISCIRSTSSNNSSSSGLGILKSNNTSTVLVCKIDGYKITISPANTQDDSDSEQNMDSRDVKALALSRDYPISSRLAMEVHFEELNSTMFDQDSDISVDATLRLGSAEIEESSKGIANVRNVTYSNRQLSMVRLRPSQEISDVSLALHVNGTRQLTSRSGQSITEKVPLGKILVVRPVSELHKQHTFSIPLTVPESHRAVRLVLKGADSLCSATDDTLPNPYAVVYLLDAEGRKLSAKKIADAQTEVQRQTCDPEWNEEFVLYGQKGLEGATAVRVKLKDRSSGKMLGDKNLGQVDIPVACFVEKIEAKLVLPVDPAGRMGRVASDSFEYGQLHVLTELVMAPSGVAVNETVQRPVDSHANSSTPLPDSSTVTGQQSDSSTGEMMEMTELSELGSGVASTSGTSSNSDSVSDRLSKWSRDGEDDEDDVDTDTDPEGVLNIITSHRRSSSALEGAGAVQLKMILHHPASKLCRDFCWPAKLLHVPIAAGTDHASNTSTGGGSMTNLLFTPSRRKTITGVELKSDGTPIQMQTPRRRMSLFSGLRTPNPSINNATDNLSGTNSKSGTANNDTNGDDNQENNPNQCYIRVTFAYLELVYPIAYRSQCGNPKSKSSVTSTNKWMDRLVEGSHESTKDRCRFLWQDILSADIVTESCCLVQVKLKKSEMKRVPRVLARKSMSSTSTSSTSSSPSVTAIATASDVIHVDHNNEEVVAEVLIAPCPAKELHATIMQRIIFGKPRQLIQKIYSYVRDVIQPSRSSLNLAFNNDDDDDIGVDESASKQQKEQHKLLSAAKTELEGIKLDQCIIDCHTALSYLQTFMTEKDTNSPESSPFSFNSNEMKIEADRARAYVGCMMHGMAMLPCKTWNATSAPHAYCPPYDESIVKIMVQHDEITAIELHPNSQAEEPASPRGSHSPSRGASSLSSDNGIVWGSDSEADVDIVTKRLLFLLQKAQQRLANLILFMGTSLDEADKVNEKSNNKDANAKANFNSTGTGGKRPSLSTIITTGDDSQFTWSSNDKAVRCIALSVTGYQKACLAILQPLVQNETAYKKIPGQLAKTAIVRFLLQENETYGSIVKPLLELAGMRYNPAGSLVSISDLLSNKNVRSPLSPSHAVKSFNFVNHLDDIVDWYAASIERETKMWLVRTFRNASDFRISAHNLPWDVQLEGKYYISTLPETFRFQLNIYLELCLSSQSLALAHGSDQNQLLRLNDKIVTAVAQSLVLLVEEYASALKGKHWSEGNDEEVTANLHFLMAVANDCHRINSTHLEMLSSVPTLGISTHQLKEEVSELCLRTAESAVISIVRIIYSDLIETLLDFDQLWEKDQGSKTVTVVASLCATLTDYFHDIVPYLETVFAENLLNKCVEVFVARYLMFLRDRAVSGGPYGDLAFSSLDQNRLSEEKDHVIECFDKAVALTDTQRGNKLDQVSKSYKRPLKSSDLNAIRRLKDTIALLVSDFSSSDAQYLIERVIWKYSKQNQLITAQNFLSCISLLHPSAGALHDLSVVPLLLRYSHDANSKSSGQKQGRSSTKINNDKDVDNDGTEIFRKSNVGNNDYHLDNELAGTGVGVSDYGEMDHQALLEELMVDVDQDSVLEDPDGGTNSRDEGLDLLVRVFRDACLTVGNSISMRDADLFTDEAHQNGVDDHVNNDKEVMFKTPSKGQSSAQTPVTQKTGIKDSKKVTTFKKLREMAADMGSLGLSSVKKRSKRSEESNSLLLQALGLREQSVPYGMIAYDGGGNGNGNGIHASSRGPEGLHRRVSYTFSDKSSSMIDKNSKWQDRYEIGSQADTITGRSDRDSCSEIYSVSGTAAGNGKLPVGMTCNCSIKLSTIKVKGARSGSLFGKANPYVAASLGNLRHKTKVKWGQNEPEWHERMIFPWDVTRLRNSKLFLCVFDKERIRRKSFLGSVTVSLAPLDMRPIEAWFALEGPLADQAQGSGAAPQIYVKIEVMREE